MFSKSESRHRAYIVAVLLCSVFPASLVFWCVGFIVGILFLYLIMTSQDYEVFFKFQVIQVVALLASILVVYRFWNIATKQIPNENANKFQAMLKRPRTVAGLLFLLVAGLLSTLLGITSYVAGWIAINRF